MQRQQKNLMIRQTANLTNKMREERQTESFEPTTPSSGSASNESSFSSSSSSRSTSRESSGDACKKTTSRAVRIQKEHVVEYDADLNSMYTKTCDTRSMNSIPEPDDVVEFEKTCEESRNIGPQIVPIKYVRTYVETPAQASFVSDFELCEAMANPAAKSLGSAHYRRVEFGRRFEAEHKFVEEILSDIDKLLLVSGRTDVELKVCKERDVNGMPRCKIQLIRKMRPQNRTLQHGVVGFDVADPAVSDGNREDVTGHISRMRRLPTSNVASRIFNSFKNRLGL